MIPVALIVASGTLALVLAVLVLARTGSLEYAAARERLLRPGAEMLAFEVPNGQDPVEVMIALRRAGYRCVEDTERATRRVLVACPHGVTQDRTGARAAIAAVETGNGSEVRFADERDQATS